MPPAVVPVEDGGGAATADEATYYSCHVAWLAWWNNVRCALASTFLPCPPAAPTSATVRGTLFLPSAGDRRVRLFLQEHGDATEHPVDDGGEHFLVLDLPPGLGGADIVAAGRIVLEYQRQWAPHAAAPGGGALLASPKWLVYCNGRRAGYAARREGPSDAEGWVLEKLRAVTAGAGRLPGGGVEYLRGRFERIVGSPDAESFHLLEPIGWPELKGGGGGVDGDGGLSIFFHRI
ncbi:hypothetical protein SETIT_9G105000v2 [Setaria italica]|uniref:Uncharacterized protein n=1 Tax=Setaria italica TaxID=4555 RepID=K4AKH5_SETIT|nr:hypothetical protein SETIT_9G105000v2 [Setaria italica]